MNKKRCYPALAQTIVAEISMTECNHGTDMCQITVSIGGGAGVRPEAPDVGCLMLDAILMTNGS